LELVVVVTAGTADDSPHAGTGDVADAAQAFVRDAVIGSLE
jgi:hypothetical protein